MSGGGEGEQNKRRSLYASGVQEESYLPRLAERWLTELTTVGLSAGWEKDSGEVSAPPSPEGRYPLSLENGERVWLRLGAWRDEEGYPYVEVSTTPLRTDRAILGALASLEGGEGPTTRDGKLDGVRVRRAYEVRRDGREAEEPIETDTDRLLDLAVSMIREYREGFDDLPEPERRELIVGACERISNAARAQRELAQFLEYGEPGRKLVPGAKNIKRDIVAAELKDIRGFSLAEITERLGIAWGERDRLKGEYRGASMAVDRGRGYLDQASGGRWAKYAALVRAKKPKG